MDDNSIHLKNVNTLNPVCEKSWVEYNRKLINPKYTSQSTLKFKMNKNPKLVFIQTELKSKLFLNPNWLIIQSDSKLDHNPIWFQTEPQSSIQTESQSSIQTEYIPDWTFSPIELTSSQFNFNSVLQLKPNWSDSIRLRLIAVQFYINSSISFSTFTHLIDGGR